MKRTRKRRFDKPGVSYFFAPIAGYCGLTDEDALDGRTRKTVDATFLADRGGRGGRSEFSVSEAESARRSRRYNRAFEDYMRTRPGSLEAREAFWRWVSLPSC